MWVAPSQINDITLKNESCTVSVIWKKNVYYFCRHHTYKTHTHKKNTHTHIHTQWDSEHGRETERERERERERGCEFCFA